MPTEIQESYISPTGWLSLAIGLAATVTETPDAFLVAVDGVDYTAAVVPDLGYDKTRGLYYLPKIAQLVYGATPEVTVIPLNDGAPIGDSSAPWDLPPSEQVSPEATLRAIIADAIEAAELIYDGRIAEVYRDRMGRPRTVTRLVGMAGAIIEVGVAYMTGEDTDATSSESDTSISVPVEVMIKGDHPDRGEDAVNLAWMVRGTLAEDVDLNGYGVCSWRWSGSAPSNNGKDLISVPMQMTLQRTAERGLCS